MAHPDAATLVRSPQYLRLLVLAAVLGVPISAVAYWFLVLTGGLGRLAVHRAARTARISTPLRRGGRSRCSVWPACWSGS